MSTYVFSVQICQQTDENYRKRFSPLSTLSIDYRIHSTSAPVSLDRFQLRDSRRRGRLMYLGLFSAADTYDFIILSIIAPGTLQSQQFLNSQG